MLKRAGLAATLLTCLASLAVAADTCFSPRDNVGLPFRVFQIAPPPAPGEEAYRYYPITDSVTLQIESIARAKDSPINAFYFLWSNRCHDVPGHAAQCGRSKVGNFLYPRLKSGDAEIRPYFTTFDKANGCTLLQARNALGEASQPLTGEGERLGLKVAANREGLLALAEDGRLVNVCVLPGEMPSNAKGILLDYEVADGRTQEMTLAFLTQFAQLVHARGKQAILFINALDAPSQRHTSITKWNASQLVRLFDFTVVFLWHNNRQASIGDSFAAQLSVLKGEYGDQKIDPKRLIALYELNNTSLADAKTVHDLTLANGLAGVMLWRNWAVVDDDCQSTTNAKIACVTKGQCS